jgi:hypothetical protein
MNTIVRNIAIAAVSFAALNAFAAPETDAPFSGTQTQVTRVQVQAEAAADSQIKAQRGYVRETGQYAIAPVAPQSQDREVVRTQARSAVKLGQTAAGFGA